MRVRSLVLLMGITAAMVGCASQPQTAPVTKVAEANDAALASTTYIIADDSAEAAFEPPPGYKERIEGGKTYYCTQVVVLGSRFPKQDCRTRTELRQMESAKASMRATMGERTGVCASANSGCFMP